MQKTKLGISAGLLASLLYLSGMLSSLVLFIIGGYILLREENEWLRRSAVKAMVLVALFAVGQEIVSIANNLFGLLSSLPAVPRIGVPLNLDALVRYALNILESLLLITLGIKALKQGTVRAGPVDKIVGKHMVTSEED